MKTERIQLRGLTKYARERIKQHSLGGEFELRKRRGGAREAPEAGKSEVSRDEGAGVIDLDELEKLAKAATPGPWIADEDMVSTIDQYYQGIEEDIVAEVFARDRDAEFAAAANPAAVLELIVRLRAAETVCKAFKLDQWIFTDLPPLLDAWRAAGGGK